MSKEGIKTASDCIFCHKCRDNCSFLGKYGIHIGDIDRLRELAYHCFLCGRCTSVCPIGIDGRQEIIDIRRSIASSDEGAKVVKRYKGLLSEKRDYRFRNYRNSNGKAAFFPGCNLPSLYPKTTARLVSILSERGIGTIYDCCGKPIGELGFKDDEERIIADLRKRLSEHGVEELVVACPNCRDFLGDRLGIKIVGIYEKLHELGIGDAIDDDILLYVPCPDRALRVWVDEIRLFARGRIELADDVQCCGLGGSAMAEEPEIAESFASALGELTGDKKLVCYCASCTGRIKRSGYPEVSHILTWILGTHESPDTSKSYINRVLTRFK